MHLYREKFESAEGDRGATGERGRGIESFEGSSGEVEKIGPGVLSAVVPIFSESRESILRRSSCFVRIWMKTRAISTLFHCFLLPLRSVPKLALSIDRRTAYHYRDGTAQRGEHEFGHSRSFAR